MAKNNMTAKLPKQTLLLDFMSQEEELQRSKLVGMNTCIYKGTIYWSKF